MTSDVHAVYRHFVINVNKTVFFAVQLWLLHIRTAFSIILIDHKISTNAYDKLVMNNL